MKKSLMILTILASMGTLTACGHREAKTDRGPAVAVTVQAAAEQSLPSAEAWTGNVRSRQAVVISTKMMGRVVRFFVDEGQAVKKGQPLVEVDAAEARSAYDQAKAGLDAADVAVRNMERDHQRFSNLYEEKAVTKHQLEQVEMGLASAQAQKAQAEANVKMAGTLLSYGRIVAPDDGIVTRKWMDAGNLAYPGAPILTLENPGDLDLSVAVPEDKARLLAVGQRARVTADGASAPLEAQVTTVVGAADAMSRTSTVKLSLPKDAGLRPGQFVRVRFEALSMKALAVPASALVSQGQMDGVFVAEDGIARLRWIQTGLRTEDHVQVLAGLSPGEAVIAPVPQGLQDGAPVEVRS